MAIDNFKDEVLADGPIGYWRLRDPIAPAGSQQYAADATGHGHRGTCTGEIIFQQDGLPPASPGGDTAALFDGATGRIAVPNSSELNPTNHNGGQSQMGWADH